MKVDVFGSCDLLKIYYLCGSNNSPQGASALSSFVVICLKFTTFVVATTVRVPGWATENKL